MHMSLGFGNGDAYITVTAERERTWGRVRKGRQEGENAFTSQIFPLPLALLDLSLAFRAHLYAK